MNPRDGAEVVFGEEVGMNASGRETALARLQARHKQIQRELAWVERKITRARDQVFSIQQRIATLTSSHRRAA
jgi:hypothetical protein